MPWWSGQGSSVGRCHELLLLWQRLRAHRLAGLHSRRQQVISRFIVDCYCHSATLVIEIDGPARLDHLEADRQRDAILSSLGLRVLRFTADEVECDLPGVLERVQTVATMPYS